MIKIDCKECGKPFEVEEKDSWKTFCPDCFAKNRKPKEQKPTPLQEIKAQAKTEEQETKERIMFGNCLNASGNALQGSCPTPKQHYDYAKGLYNLWIQEKKAYEKELLSK